MVFTARSGLHCDRYSLGPPIRPWSTLGCVPASGDASAICVGHSGFDDSLRLLHGPGMYGSSFSCDVCLCTRRLLPWLLVDQASQQAYCDTCQCRLVQYCDWHSHDITALWRSPCHRCHLLHWSFGCFRGFHHTYIHQGLLCR